MYEHLLVNTTICTVKLFYKAVTIFRLKLNDGSSMEAQGGQYDFLKSQQHPFLN